MFHAVTIRWATARPLWGVLPISDFAPVGNNFQARRKFVCAVNDNRNKPRQGGQQDRSKHIPSRWDSINPKVEIRNPKDKPTHEQFCFSGFGFRPSGFGLCAQTVREKLRAALDAPYPCADSYWELASQGRIGRSSLGADRKLQSQLPAGQARSLFLCDSDG